MRVVGIFLLALSLWAEAQVPAQPAQSTSKGSIAGTVVSAASGEPLRKTTVLLARVGGPTDPRTANTDERGQFVFRSVEPGRYRLVASCVGYIRLPMESVFVNSGQEVKDLLFRLTPAGAISGRVVDDDGEPIMEARVRALRSVYTRGRRELIPAATATTNDHGEYRLFNLSPGRYYLSATYEGGFVQGFLMGVRGVSGDPGLDEVYAPVFYPGTNDASQATPVDLRGGDDISGFNLMMSQQRTFRVNGRVFNSVTGQAGRNVQVRLVPRTTVVARGANNDYASGTDEQGNFHFRGVLPGSYTLIAETETWITTNSGAVIGGVMRVEGGIVGSTENRHYTGRLTVDVGTADLDGLNVVIVGGTDILGTVRFEGIGQTAKPNQLRVTLEPTEDSGLRNSMATVRPDGTFILNNVPDDTYRVNVGNLPDGAYLKSARMAGQEVLDDGLVMTRGRRGPLDLVVSTNAGSVNGTVTNSDHKPFAGARLLLAPEGSARSRLNLFRPASTDQYGRFSIPSVPPGDYKLFAWDNVESGAYQDPDFLRQFEDRGQTVHVTEGNQSTADVQVIITEPRGQ